MRRRHEMSSTTPSRLKRRISDGTRAPEDLASTVRSPSLNDQDVEVQRLQKATFNMKLRIFYLEERLAQRMCPHRTSPVISSMLADSPTSLNGWSLPEKS